MATLYWIAYSSDTTIWGIGHSEETAIIDATRTIFTHEDGSDEQLAGTAQASIAVVAMVNAIGGAVEDWAEYNQKWALDADGIARLTTP